MTEAGALRRRRFLETLRFFLRMPQDATPVLEHFAAMPNARFHDFGGEERFVYIPATRGNPVLLIAHADTCRKSDCPTELLEDDDTIRNANPNRILGADDRAGCAMVSILGPMLGHGILITDGEESGQIGARALMEKSGIGDELQMWYQFMVEIDRRENRNFKCYDVGTAEFKKYVKKKTGYRCDEESRFATDICVLARDICGVNLATGFYNEHNCGNKDWHENEYLKKSDWLETLDLAIKWLGESGLPRFRTNAAAAQTALKRGIEYYNIKEYGSAIEKFTEAIKLDPNNTSAYYERARTFEETGYYGTAFSDYGKLIELDPNCADAYCSRSMIHRLKGDIDKAISDGTEAIRLDPNEYMAYCRQNEACSVKGDYSAALSSCTEAIRLDSNCVQAYYWRGSACNATGEYDNAIRDYTEAIRIDPNMVFFYTDRGDAYNAKGEYDNAIRDYTEAINVEPDYPMSYFGRGKVYRSLGQRDKAIADFEETLSLIPNDEEAREALREMLEPIPGKKE